MNNDVMVIADTPVTSIPSASPVTSSSLVQQDDKQQSTVYPEEWRHVDQVNYFMAHQFWAVFSGGGERHHLRSSLPL